MLLKRNTQSNSFILTVVGLTYVVDDSHLLAPVQSDEEQGLVTKFISISQGGMCTQTGGLNLSFKETHKILLWSFTVVPPTYLVDIEHELAYHSQLKNKI